MTKQIPLTQSKFAIVDDEDFEYLNQWKWYVHKNGNNFYAVRGFPKRIQMHRVVMNTSDGIEVDHIDGNGLNNTRSNLRNCTHVQNMQNRKKNSDNTSGYKGVDWHNEKWRAQITINKKIVFLGYFSSIEDAAHAYDTAAKEGHGNFAKTNF